MEGNQRWHFEMEDQGNGPTLLRAVAICNGTTYKSRPERWNEKRRDLVAALCLHSLTARLVSLMYNQRNKAFEIIRKRQGVSWDITVALGNLGRWLDYFGRRVKWTDGSVDLDWIFYRGSLRSIICDLQTLAPGKASPFYDNYLGKYLVIYSFAASCEDLRDFAALIPEVLPAEQLSLF